MSAVLHEPLLHTEELRRRLQLPHHYDTIRNGQKKNLTQAPKFFFTVLCEK